MFRRDIRDKPTRRNPMKTVDVIRPDESLAALATLVAASATVLLAT
jgi:hypothetical protein